MIHWSILKVRHFRLINAILGTLVITTSIKQAKNHIQHGTTSVFEHCLSVCYLSLRIANLFHIKIDENSLIRGALLHDYFLYDWHDTHTGTIWHGFYHPTVALNNALQDCALNETEQDIIKHHMFPLTPIPPKTKEGAIICVADKICSLYETFKVNEWHGGKYARKHWNEDSCNKLR